MSDLSEIRGKVVFHIEVPAEERDLNTLWDIAEAYAVSEIETADCGCVIWAKYRGEWKANPFSTRWLVLHLLKQIPTTEGQE